MLPESGNIEELVGLFPETDGPAVIGKGIVIDTGLIGGAAKCRQAVGNDPMLPWRTAGGHSGLHGTGDGGKRRQEVGDRMRGQKPAQSGVAGHLIEQWAA